MNSVLNHKYCIMDIVFDVASVTIGRGCFQNDRNRVTLNLLSKTEEKFDFEIPRAMLRAEQV